MTETKLRQIMRDIIAEYQSRPFHYWTTVEFPLEFERNVDDEIVIVQILYNEHTDDHLSLIFIVDAEDARLSVTQTLEVRMNKMEAKREFRGNAQLLIAFRQGLKRIEAELQHRPPEHWRINLLQEAIDRYGTGNLQFTVKGVVEERSKVTIEIHAAPEGKLLPCFSGTVVITKL